MKKHTGGVSLATAAAIMGRNFLGPDNIIQHPGLRLARFKRELDKASLRVPFSRKQLEKHKHDCVLFFDSGASVMNVYNLHPELFLGQNTFYKKHPFAMGHRKPCWRLIHKAPIVGSNSLSLTEQLKLLKKGQRLPKVGAFTTLVFGYYLKTGKWLCPGVLARCSDVYMVGRGVVAGKSKDQFIGYMLYDWQQKAADRQIWLVPEETPLKG